MITVCSKETSFTHLLNTVPDKSALSPHQVLGSNADGINYVSSASSVAMETMTSASSAALIGVQGRRQTLFIEDILNYQRRPVSIIFGQSSLFLIWAEPPAAPSTNMQPCSSQCLANISLRIFPWIVPGHPFVPDDGSVARHYRHCPVGAGPGQLPSRRRRHRIFSSNTAAP